MFCLLFLLPSVFCGPQTSPQPNITDQQLLWGADQYEFSVVLPAAGTECVWHFAHRGETFYLNFQVQWVTGVGQDRHLTVTVNAPSGLLLTNQDEARGQIKFEAKETGFYQMCLSNFHNRFNSMQVFLSFGVYYDQQVEPERSDLNNTLSVIKGSTQTVEKRVFHMFRHHSVGRMRRSADYFLLVSNSWFITCWSAALSLLCVTCGYLQLRFLKSLFVSSAEEEKPRC